MELLSARLIQTESDPFSEFSYRRNFLHSKMANFSLRWNMVAPRRKLEEIRMVEAIGGALALYCWTEHRENEDFRQLSAHREWKILSRNSLRVCRSANLNEGTKTEFPGKISSLDNHIYSICSSKSWVWLLILSQFFFFFQLSMSKTAMGAVQLFCFVHLKVHAKSSCVAAEPEMKRKVLLFSLLQFLLCNSKFELGNHLTQT